LQEDLQQDAASVGNTNDFKVNVNSALQISSSQRGLLKDENHHIRKHRMLTSITNIFKLQRLTPSSRLASPSMQKTEGRYEFSHFVPSFIREKLRKAFIFFYGEDLLAISREKLQKMD